MITYSVGSAGETDEDAASYKLIAEKLSKASETLGPGWVSELLAEAENIISALETRVKVLEGELAEIEDNRQWRLVRQREGITAAQARGVSFGRPRKPVPENFETVKALWCEGKISSRKGAEMLGICQDTFLRWCRRD